MPEEIKGPNPASNGERLKQRELTREETGEFLFWSFFYSQGDLKLHEKIFQAVAKIHPEWKINVGSEKGFLMPQLPRYERYFKSSHMEFSVEDDSKKEALRKRMDKVMKEDNLSEKMAYAYTFLEDQLYLMETAFSKKDKSNYDLNSVNGDIISRMVERDRYNLYDVTENPDGTFSITKKQRPKSETRPARGPFSPDFSQFISFVLRGEEKPPGPEVFGELMAGVRKSLNDERTVSELPSKTIAELMMLLDHTGANLDAYPLFKKHWPQVFPDGGSAGSQ